jgi:hypothetical protein
MMDEKDFKWIVPEEVPAYKRVSQLLLEAFDYLNKVKVCSRFELRRKFDPRVIRLLMSHEKVGFVDLSRSKRKTSSLFNVSKPFREKLFILYLKGEEEALIDYLANLIKKPLDRYKAKAISSRLKRLDNLTRLKVIERAGYNYKSDECKKILFPEQFQTKARKRLEYDECLEEFIGSEFKSVAVNIPDVKPKSLVSELRDRIKRKGLKDKVMVCLRSGKVFLVRLNSNKAEKDIKQLD